MTWHPLAIAAVVGVISAAISHGGMFSFPGTLLGAATGFAVDDPSYNTLAASPTSLLRRRLHRLAVMVPVAVLAWAVLVLVAASDTPEALTLVAMFAGLLALSIGFASTLARRSAGRGGALGASALLFALIVSSIVSPRWRPLPLGDVPGGWVALQVRWSLAAVIGMVIFLASSRDLAARPIWSRP